MTQNLYYSVRHTQFRHQLRERDERYVLGVPCNTTMRDLEAPLPAYAGRGRPPKAPWQSVTQWRQALPGDAWTHLTVRDGEKGPVVMGLQALWPSCPAGHDANHLKYRIIPSPDI